MQQANINLMDSVVMCMIAANDTHEAAMRTNIDIDDRLMEQAMKATGQRTKKATVEAALRKVITLSNQVAALEALRGIGWEGDLDEMRNDWTPDVDWALQDKK